MKKNLLLVLLVILIGFTGYVFLKKGDVSVEEIEMITSYLASDKLEGRETGSVGIETAAGYIENVFQKNNIKPYFDTYRDNFDWGIVNAYNIVGFIEGNDPKLKNEIVIIGAHYDHLGNLEKMNGDDIANGANDNASGTAAVILMAKHFAEKKSNKRSIIVALFSAEEKGMLGSQHLAK